MIRIPSVASLRLRSRSAPSDPSLASICLPQPWPLRHIAAQLCPQPIDESVALRRGVTELVHQQGSEEHVGGLSAREHHQRRPSLAARRAQLGRTQQVVLFPVQQALEGPAPGRVRRGVERGFDQIHVGVDQRPSQLVYQIRSPETELPGSWLQRLQIREHMVQHTRHLDEVAQLRQNRAPLMVALSRLEIALDLLVQGLDELQDRAGVIANRLSRSQLRGGTAIKLPARLRAPPSGSCGLENAGRRGRHPRWHTDGRGLFVSPAEARLAEALEEVQQLLEVLFAPVRGPGLSGLLEEFEQV